MMAIYAILLTALSIIFFAATLWWFARGAALIDHWADRKFGELGWPATAIALLVIISAASAFGILASFAWMDVFDVEPKSQKHQIEMICTTVDATTNTSPKNPNLSCFMSSDAVLGSRSSDRAQ